MKRTLLSFVVMLAFCHFSYAYDFSVVVPSGQRLYFNILTNPPQGSVNGKGTAEVTHPVYNYPYYNDSQRPSGDIVIPSNVTANGRTYWVVQIAQSAFYNCNNITSVVIPQTVHTIWGSAFGHCGKLREVTIPDDCAVSIRSSAFSYCDSLTTITLGNMVDTLYSHVFYACNNITTINLNTEHLGNNYAQFADARVRNVNIGPSVKYIPRSLFQNCDSLTSVIIPDSVTIIGSNAFAGCNNLSDIILGSQLNNIMSSAFSGSAITRLFLPDNIRMIGEYTFSNCTSLRYAHTGNYIDSIPAHAFTGCVNLDTLSTCCTYIGSFAFNNCDSIRTIIYNARKKYIDFSGNPLFLNKIPNLDFVNKLIIGDSVRTISHGMFGNLGIAELELGNSVKVIEYNAFYNCHNLTSVTLPEQIDTLHEGAFWNDSSLHTVIYKIARCNVYKPQSSAIDHTPATVFPQCPIDSVLFAANVRVIPDGLMRGRNLSYVQIPDSLESIGNYAFEGSGIGIFPDMVSSIGDYAFANCTNLRDTLVIPENIQTIGKAVFSGCNNLTNVSLYNTMTTIPDNTFENCTRIMGQLTLPQSITNIGRCAFRNNGISGKLFLPNSVTNIGDSAFAGCANLTDTLVIPNALTSIGNGVFKRCSQLQDVVFHAHITTIGQEAFMNCSNLRRVYVPKLYTPTNPAVSLKTASFANCEKIAIVDIRRYAGLGCYAFANCDSLTVARFNGVGFSTTGNVYSSSSQLGLSGHCRQFYNCNNLRRVRTTVPYRLELYPSIFVGCSSFDTLILDTLWASWSNPYGDSIGHPITVLYPCDQHDHADGLTGFDDFTQFNIIGSPFVGRGLFDAGYDLFSCSSSDTSAGTVNCLSNGCNLIVTASPKPGYVFSEWSDGSKMNPHYAKGVVNATAYFSQAYYLTVSSSDPSRGTAIGSDSVEYSSIKYISAIPNQGYHFSHWNDGNTANPRSVQVNYHMQFTAYFAPNDAITEYVYIHDTTMVSYPVHDTTYINVPYAVHDTTFIGIHDTTYIDVPYAVHDTTCVDIIIYDTTTVTDTVTLTEYVQIHDTTYIDVHDTTFIDVPYAVYDTTYINIHDTAYIDVPYAVHDTTYVDVYIYDTTVVTDTVTVTEYVPVHDTTYITLTDMVTNTVYDTVINTVFDTIDNYIYDTTIVLQTDTLWMYDTVYIHDTIYIYDTVYVGVDEAETISAKIYTSRQQIVVEGADGNTVWLYDVNGRVLATKQDEYMPLRFEVPASGAYMVKIGNHPARKVVVIR